jgi:hypothetical protein
MSDWWEDAIQRHLAMAAPEAREVVEHIARRHSTLSGWVDGPGAFAAHLRCHHYGPMVAGDDHPVDDLSPARPETQ